MLIRYGATIGFTTAQVEAWRLELVRAQAAEAGLSEVEKQAKVHEEEERIALEKLEAQQKKVTAARQAAIDQQAKQQAAAAAGEGPMQSSAATGGLPGGDTGPERAPVFQTLDAIDVKLRYFRESAGDALGTFQRQVGDDAGAWQKLRDLVAAGIPVKEAVAEVTSQLQMMHDVTDILTAGFNSLFTAIGEGSKFGASEFLRAMARMAAAKAAFEFAEGLSTLATSIFPGIPTAGVSAATHFKSAAIFGLLAGGLSFAAGAAGGGGGGGGAASGGTFGATGPGKGGSATIVIQGGLLDMSNPTQADAFAKAYKELASRGITDVVVVGG